MKLVLFKAREVSERPPRWGCPGQNAHAPPAHTAALTPRECGFGGAVGPSFLRPAVLRKWAEARTRLKSEYLNEKANQGQRKMFAKETAPPSRPPPPRSGSASRGRTRDALEPRSVRGGHGFCSCNPFTHVLDRLQPQPPSVGLQSALDHERSPAGPPHGGPSRQKDELRKRRPGRRARRRPRKHHSAAVGSGSLPCEHPRLELGKANISEFPKVFGK